MSVFLGGSAFAMANQISAGYIIVSVTTFRQFKPHDVKTLEVEIDKLSRELRGEAIPIDDLQAIQTKNRRLGRLKQAGLILRSRAQQR